jgi:trigger factor
MQVTETLSDGLKRGWTVVVPAADIQAKRQARLTEVAKTVTLPGFRPGKVPMAVIKTRYGAAVMGEVLEEAVNEATRSLLEERGLRSAVQPKVDVVNIGDATDLEFKVELELMPSITLPDFSTLELTRMKAVPTDEAIGRALDDVAKRQRELVPVAEARGAAVGEILTVDFLGKVDGVPFPGGEGKDVDLEVAGSGFIPGFTEQVVGMAPGDSKTIDVTFPAEYGSKDLAGKAATFDITVKALKTQVLPPIDDEMAKKVGFDTLDELRGLIVQQMQREFDQLGRLRVKRQLLDKLAEEATFPAPQGMVDSEFEQIWQRLEADRKEGRADGEDAGKDDETLKAEYRAIAERRVKLGLLLAEIGRTHSLSVSADEMTRAMRAEAGRYQGQEQMVMDFFRKNPQAAETLRGPIFEEKVVDFVLELAKVAETMVSPEELTREPEPATAG